MSFAEEDIPASAPRPGDLFAEKYRVERILGVGGMGYVLAATHVHLDDRVAIKMLLPHLTSDSETVDRFLREGRAAVKIRSEHVARVLDVGKLSDQTPYLVMEYLEGDDFSDVLRRRGALPHAVAVDYVLQACEAVAEAHAHGTVHRDLKPSNMFLAKRPGGAECVKVLDFGISKMNAQETGGLAMTRTSALMGSPLYMSPEQLRNSRTVDARSDIWAIGVILYELISGTPPFFAKTLPELGALVLSGDTPWLDDAVPGIPPGLAAVVATCLSKRTEQRFANLADFADSVAPFGTSAARASAERIAQTLGLPPVRATIASRGAPRPPSSDPDLAMAQTLAITPSAAQPTPSSRGSAAASGSAPTPSNAGYGISHAAASQQPAAAPLSRAGATMIVGAFVLLACVGVGAMIASRVLPEQNETALGPAARASSVGAGAAPPATPASATPPPLLAPSSAVSGSSAPGSPPSGRSSAPSAPPPKPARPSTKRAAAVAAPLASTAADTAAPVKPSAIATSSKD